MSCWDNRTAFETALLLALLVSVPFLIFMVMLYVTVGSVGETLSRISNPVKFINCERACKCFAHFEKSIPIPTIDNEKSTPQHAPNAEGAAFRKSFNLRSITDSCLSEDSNMAAIVKMLYVDDPNDAEYLCPAAIISPIYLATGADCPIANATHLYARIGSDYWTKYGYVHEIRKLRTSGRILLMELAVPIQIDVHFARIGDLNDTTFSIYGWNRRAKHEESLTDDLLLVDNGFCNMSDAKNAFCGVSKKNACVNDTSFLPMVGDELIGVFHTVSCDAKGFFYGFRKILSFNSYIQIIMNNSLY